MSIYESRKPKSSSSNHIPQPPKTSTFKPPVVQTQPEDGQVMPKMTSAADWWRSSGLVHEAGLAGLQFKLTLGQPADQYEQEADRVAAQVVSQINAPQPSQQVQRQEQEEETLQMQPAAGVIQREELPSEEETLQMQPLVQRQAVPGATAAPLEVEDSIQQAKGGGQALPDLVRQPMEQAFGTSFEDVRIHTDSEAHTLNQSLQAKAFTTGQDIFFRQGEFNPGSTGGQELLAHELTHVVQQTGGAPLQQVQRQETEDETLMRKPESTQAASADGLEQMRRDNPMLFKPWLPAIDSPQADPKTQAPDQEQRRPPIAFPGHGPKPKEYPASFKGVDLNFAALVEQISFMTYEAEKPEEEGTRAKLLKAYGYNMGHHVVGLEGFEMRIFMPLPKADPNYKPDLTPIVAFRGTEAGKAFKRDADGVADVDTDLNPAGVGFNQFEKNKPIIQKNLVFASMDRPAIVTGHSLGGALAQMAATEPKFQPLIARVVTFASPGINRERIKTIEQYNQTHKSHEILSTHYRIKDKDLVPKGGEAWTPGLIHEFGMYNPTGDKIRFGGSVVAAVVSGASGRSVFGQLLEQGMNEGVGLVASLVDAGLAHMSQPVTDAALAYDPQLFPGLKRDPETTYQDLGVRPTDRQPGTMEDLRKQTGQVTLQLLERYEQWKLSRMTPEEQQAYLQNQQVLKQEEAKYQNVYNDLEKLVRAEKTKPGVDNWEEVHKRHQHIIAEAKISDDKDREYDAKRRLNRALLDLWYAWHPEVQFSVVKGRK
ncbi:eCIS core domain-containing protein [Anthocerotibacter panamensis]|uniref:eCIS core domain-containing protein n=1 Tax=Anthocerotibacter panamensis TaxID=2857077 RepID=UPI001C407389|nr:DUF4157 domain-containing protein [Anthocerotibacter panamensis]